MQTMSLAVVLGLLTTVTLLSHASFLLTLMGAPKGGELHSHALPYLRVRRFCVFVCVLTVRDVRRVPWQLQQC
jgi:Na+-driven multidrug efflux pump